MHILWKQHLFLLGIALASASFLSICTPYITPALYATQLTRISRPPRKNTPHTHAYISTRMPATQTNCPSMARAAVRIPLNGGKRQTLVYSYNTSNSGLLIRYDIKSRKKTTLLNLDNATISNAQLSPDGYFVLFVTQVNNQLAIQMVRIDGRGLQTLYCAPNSKEPINFIDDLLWSPDQQRILFRVPDPIKGKAAPMLQLLDLVHGSLQMILAPSDNTGYIPRIWPTSNEVYMQGYALDNSDSIPPHDVYVLNLLNKRVRHVASIAGYDWDMSLTPDDKNLLLGQGAALPPQQQPQPPSFISVQAAAGSKVHVLYTSHAYAVTQIRAISKQMLLFVLGGRFASGTHNGLWKININGTDLTQLTKDGKLLSDQHTIWSDISRDGHMYAVASYSSLASDKGQTTILYGPLNGGRTTAVDTTDVSDNAQVVGWTVL